LAAIPHAGATMPDAAPPPDSAKPEGELVMRTIAMPADTNANGDIFGGWLMSQMDLGGAVLARMTARSRVVTVAVEGMTFVAPVNVGDIVSCYATLKAVGRTSMKIDVAVWTHHYADAVQHRVTEGKFTYVAIDDAGKSQPVRR
jgi:acyl-CoA thioesterase YciA